ncbi:hypothetical protein SAMN02927895_01829 [Belnapia rosea]|nr:hypothetical protein SAMN02927895_01829 [Belnapia rosea]
MSGLADTIKGFAARFAKIEQQEGTAPDPSRYSFRFVTNRPIADSVTKAVDSILSNTPAEDLPKRIKDAREALLAAIAMPIHQTIQFLRCLEFHGGQPALTAQAQGLSTDARQIIPGGDIDVAFRLKEMVRQRTLSASDGFCEITRETVLAALGVDRVEDLLPAPSAIEPPSVMIERDEFRRIAEAIRQAEAPVIVRAPGGFGKSMLTLDLPRLMPAGSATVIYDCFNGGNYRALSSARHRVGTTVVQITNDLAGRSLCQPLLPRASIDASTWMRAFRVRLEQAAAAVMAANPQALIVVIVDAGDNAEMIARDRKEESFAREILREVPPPGVRLVVLCRPEREHLLSPPVGLVPIDLAGFDPAESAAHLRGRFSDASLSACDNFHRLSAANPRVQATFLAAAESLGDMFKLLGPAPLGADDLIGRQLHDAMAKAEELFGGRAALNDLAAALAVLPPAVPLDILAMAARSSVAAVQSFVADFAGGRPIRLISNAVQFRDEPTESWFRNNYRPDAAAHARLADLLAPIAASHAYAALALPALLESGGRYDALLTLALHGESFAGNDPVARRDVAHARAGAALRSAISRQDWPSVGKLLARTAEDAANRDRQAEFLCRNADLVAALGGDDQVTDFVFRGAGNDWRGEGHAHCAAMLAGVPTRRVEAIAFLNAAHAWIAEWSRTPPDSKGRRRGAPSEDAVASIALAQLTLGDAMGAAREITRWQNGYRRYGISRKVARRLGGASRYSDLAALIAARVAAPEMMVACASALVTRGKGVDEALARRVLKAMTKVEVPQGMWDREQASVALAKVSAIELCLLSGVPAEELRQVAAALLPQENDRRSSHSSAVVAFQLRALALHAALRGQPADPTTLLPPAPDEQRKPGAQERKDAHSEALSRIRELLPFYTARAQRLVAKGSGKNDNVDWAEAVRTMTRGRLNARDRWTRSEDVQEALLVAIDGLAFDGEGGLENIARMIEALPREFTPSAHLLANVAERLITEHTENALDVWLPRAREAAFSDKSSRAEVLSDLARYSLPHSREDAAALFREATDAIEALGEEYYARYEALATACRRAVGVDGVGDEDVHRFARVCEFLHDHNDHKFPWEEIASILGALHPGQALAVVMRWDDRGLVPLDRTLDAAAVPALRTGWLDGRAIAVLHAIVPEWDYKDSLAPALARLSPGHRNLIVDFILRDLASLPHSDRELEQIRTATQGIAITPVASTRGRGEVSPEVRLAGQSRKPTPEEDARDAQMRAAALAGDPLTEDGLAAIAEEARKIGPGSLDQVLTLVHAKIEVADLPKFLSAICERPEVSLYALVHFLRRAKTDKGHRPAIAAAVRGTASRLPTLRALSLASSPWQLNDLADLAESSVPELLKATLLGLVDRADKLSGESLFRLAGWVSNHLVEKPQCVDVMRYLVARTETLFPGEFGDGPWCGALGVPDHSAAVVAHLLYATLASPRPAERWRAAHAVRRLAALDWNEAIDLLASLLREDPTASPFRCASNPFYRLHARLYLLIAFARVASERQDPVAHLGSLFTAIALEGPAHVLIKLFAARAALALGGMPAKSVAELAQIGRPQRASAPRDINFWVKDYLGDAVDGLRVPMDFDRYWIVPLARAFGVPTEEVAAMAADGLRNLQHDPSATQARDARGGDRLGRRDTTYPRHGTAPSFELIDFYLCWHGLMAAADRLFSERAPVRESYGTELALEWLDRFDLTKSCQRWLADSWQATPVLLRSREDEYVRENRGYTLLAADLDGLLEHDGRSIVVTGSASTMIGYQRERWAIQAAIVPAGSAPALIRAAQSAPNFHQAYLPGRGDRDAFSQQRGPFSAYRLIEWQDREHGLDDSDPFAGGLSHPGWGPTKVARRLLGLKIADLGRNWMDREGMLVFSRQEWGAFPQDDSDDPPRAGSRMIASFATLLPFLERARANLVLRVEVERKEKERRDYDESPQPYCRFYSLDQRGRVSKA